MNQLDSELKKTMDVIGLLGDMALAKDNCGDSFTDPLELLDMQATLLNRYNKLLEQYNSEREFNRILAHQWATDPYGDRV